MSHEGTVAATTVTKSHLPDHCSENGVHLCKVKVVYSLCCMFVSENSRHTDSLLSFCGFTLELSFKIKFIIARLLSKMTENNSLSNWVLSADSLQIRKRKKNPPCLKISKSDVYHLKATEPTLKLASNLKIRNKAQTIFIGKIPLSLLSLSLLTLFALPVFQILRTRYSSALGLTVALQKNQSRSWHASEIVTAGQKHNCVCFLKSLI